MKSPLSLLALAGLCALASVSQIGCAGVYAVAPAPAYYAPAPVVGVYGWGGAGFYGGTYYRTSTAYYNSSYYRNNYYYRGGHGAAYRTPWSNGGYYNTNRGGSASWHNGSGTWSGNRGRSGSWHRR